jgi:8-oxo-dGTP diphosphatase
MTTSTRPFVVVACAVIQGADGRILAAQRAFDKSLGGKWEFPGGKIEPGETPSVALVRELQEELGILTEVGHALSVVRYDYEEFSIELHPFVVTILSGEMIAMEHEEIRWITLDEAPAIDWAEADIPIWQELAGKTN